MEHWVLAVVAGAAFSWAIDRSQAYAERQIRKGRLFVGALVILFNVAATVALLVAAIVGVRL